jgi:hypothetical protein
LILPIVGAASIKVAVTVGVNAPLTFGKKTESKVLFGISVSLNKGRGGH